METRKLSEGERHLLESFETIFPKLSKYDQDMTLSFAMGLLAKNQPEQPVVEKHITQVLAY